MKMAFDGGPMDPALNRPWNTSRASSRAIKWNAATSIGDPFNERLAAFIQALRGIVHARHGNYGRSFLYSAMAISDMFLVKALLSGAGRIALGAIARLTLNAETASKGIAAPILGDIGQLGPTRRNEPVSIESSARLRELN